jgi:hypothetical protein
MKHDETEDLNVYSLLDAQRPATSRLPGHGGDDVLLMDGERKMQHWNPTRRQWQSEPFMVKPHTVGDGALVATVVVVPMPVKGEEGKAAVIFVPMGVRIEDTRSQFTIDARFVIPGHSWFFRFSTRKISESCPWRVRMHRCGPYLLGSGSSPDMLPPTKEKGVPWQEHRLGFRLMALVNQAKASYAEWLQGMRATPPCTEVITEVLGPPEPLRADIATSKKTD